MEPWKTDLVLVFMQRYLKLVHVPETSQINRLVQRLTDPGAQTKLRLILLHWIHFLEGHRGADPRCPFFNHSIGQLVAYIQSLEENNPSHREDLDDEISKEDDDSDHFPDFVDDYLSPVE